MLNKFVAELLSLTGCSAVGIFLLNEQKQWSCHACQGFSPEYCEAVTAHLSITGVEMDYYRKFGYQSATFVPIRLGERILGLIQLADPAENKIPPKMTSLLGDAAKQLALAVQKMV